MEAYLEMAEAFLAIRQEQLRTAAGQRLTRSAQGEFSALDYLLAREGGAHPCELSREMAVSTARVAALLHHMEERGWIERAEDARDGRQIRVTLTQAGRREILARREGLLRGVARTLRLLGPEDAREYLRLQRKLADICLAMGAQEDGSPTDTKETKEHEEPSIISGKQVSGLRNKLSTNH